MEKIKRVLPLLFSFVILLIVYHAWFEGGILSGGDVGMTFRSMFSNDYLYPFAWYWNQGAGLGGNAAALLWIYTDFAYTRTLLGHLLGFSWGLTERLAYFFPFLVIGYISSITLAKRLCPKSPFLVLSALIFLINSYILMVVGGGQLWIFLSYALTPLVLFLCIQAIDNTIDLGRCDVKKSLFIGLLFSLLFLLDLRIAYAALTTVFLYWVYIAIASRKYKDSLQSLLFVFVIPGIIVLFTHAFWLLPTILIGQSPLKDLGSAYSTTEAVKYFSFAKFENAFSLLHPNWPENVFGKVYFMRWEFLIFPIIAFSSIFFVSKKNSKKLNHLVLFFCLLGLIGAFLAKGAQDPFGGVYLWLFTHIPGFVMFRDPTKWFLLVAVSYAMLIPFSLQRIYEWIQARQKFSIKSKIYNIQNLFLFLIVFFLLFPIRPALFSQLGGVLKTTKVPREYAALDNFISSQNQFFRTFWVPSIQRFGINSKDHPAIPGMAFLETQNIFQTADFLSTSEDILQDSSVKYVIVPYDSEGEIFVTNRTYDRMLYSRTMKRVQEIPWLHSVRKFKKIGVFEVAGPKDHFWSTDSLLHISYTQKSPTEYTLSISNAKKYDRIIFSETFDPHWQATAGSFTILSTRYLNRFNSFLIPINGSYILDISFSPQKWVQIGVWISITTLILVVGMLLIPLRKFSGKGDMVK